MPRIILILLIAFIFISGCETEPVQPKPILTPNGGSIKSEVRNQIAVCSAGLNERIRRKIFAEFDRYERDNAAEISLGTNLGSIVLGAIFSDHTITSSDKVKLFQGYIQCVTDTNFSEGRQCQRVVESCAREQGNRLNSCLEKSRNACISECIFKFGNSRNECVSRLCKPTVTNLTHWTSKRCESEQEDLFICEEDYRACLSQ